MFELEEFQDGWIYMKDTFINTRIYYDLHGTSGVIFEKKVPDLSWNTSSVRKNNPLILVANNKFANNLL